MTKEETRQLGIEVERRLQTILPTFRIENKIDTDDIYSFLNQFQRQYVDAIYKQNDQLQPGTRLSAVAEDVLKTLTKSEDLTGEDIIDNRTISYDFPEGYYRYIRSVSTVNGNYKSEEYGGMVSNVLVRQSDVNSVIEQIHDNNRILRNPVVILEDNKMILIHDKYTDVESVNLTFISRPANFGIGENCELPFECFEDLVTGTVDLYVRHITATQPKQQKKEDDK